MEHLWVAGCCSVPGASHRRRRLVINQDAAGASPDQNVIAVADGHGSEEHLLSDIGSQCAVAQALVGDPRSLPQRWRAAVLQDIYLRGGLDQVIQYRQPLIEEAQVEKILTQVRRDPVRAAGSTVLWAGTGRQADQVMLYQVGDGRVLLLDQAGQVFLPMAPDRYAGRGPLTSSLCLEQAAEVARWQPWQGATPLAMILLMTDGFSDGYSDEQLGEIARGLLGFACRQGMAGLLQELPGDLERISEQGVGDDTTLALMIRRDLLPPCDKAGSSPATEGARSSTPQLEAARP